MNLKMKIFRRAGTLPAIVLLGTFFPLAASPAAAQVHPAEIVNPQLKTLEETYFQQLIALNHKIAAAKFPLEFKLSRYVGLSPKQQEGADSRGLEFVKFRDRFILKVTGNYNAAYNADLLTQNQRASRTFLDVFLPILRILTQDLPPDLACDGIGLEISYHVRRRTKASDFEGKEILVVVFDRDKAFGFAGMTAEQQQDVVSHSLVYVDGKEFGLALNQADPIDVQALNPSFASAAASAVAAPPASHTLPSYAAASSEKLTLHPAAPAPGTPEGGPVTPGQPAKTEAPEKSATPATQESVDRAQAKYQAQLDSFAKEGASKFHFVDYAPPAFALFRKQVALQITLRNPKPFDPEATSIYKRAARSFDLFLAPQLKGMLEKLPADLECDALDITVLNQLGPKTSSSEALEFVFPLAMLRQFTDAEITNQELINRSIVLVNGVRVAINLQQVE
ncbi:MAG: hypothetical protein LAN71_11440 [Acidobacteriia bacterium]|nr:hypothetical protein [Terriglobia bacterium]